jgi:hypothetical protein
MNQLLGSIIILSLALLHSCQEPRSERTALDPANIPNNTSNNTASNPYVGFENDGNTRTDTDTDTDTNNNTDPTDNTPTPTGSPTIPEEVRHCQWSVDGINGFQNSGHAHLSPTESSASEGAFTICQSRTNETIIYLQLKASINDAQVCVFPTYEADGKSVYLGEPRCLLAQSPKTIYKVNLLKNRSGYSSYPVTGVMVMKDKSYFYQAPFYQFALSPDAYTFCSQWMAQYGDPSYCSSFKQGGHYVYQKFIQN